MFINKISPTKASVIDECLYKYWARYIKRYKGIDTNKDALNFGSYIHKIFELGVAKTSEKELRAIGKQIREQYVIEDTAYEKKTNKCLRNFLRFKSTLPKIIGTERLVEAELAPGIVFNGVIDLVVEGKNGGILVIDYKTSKREKNKATLYQDGQMRGYCWAISELMNIPIEKITCAHYYPLTNNFVPVKFKKGDILKWQKQAISKVWDVRKRKADQFPPTKNQFCNWCAYKHICPLHTNHIERERSILLEEKRLEEDKKLKEDTSPKGEVK
jgi:CRISPR/Cas system-associated exonuclease Cas4 (RecB family)